MNRTLTVVLSLITSDKMMMMKESAAPDIADETEEKRKKERKIEIRYVCTRTLVLFVNFRSSFYSLRSLDDDDDDDDAKQVKLK